MLTAKAREQIERLLQYAAAGGNAALVNTHTGTLIATDGGADSTGLIEQLKALDLRLLAVEDISGVTLGQVGASYLLVVKSDEIQVDCSPLKSRIAKACDMLTRMVEHASERAAAQYKPWMGND